MREIEIGSIGYRRRILTIDMTEQTGFGQPYKTRRLTIAERLRVLFGARLVLRLKRLKEV